MQNTCDAAVSTTAVHLDCATNSSETEILQCWSNHAMVCLYGTYRRNARECECRALASVFYFHKLREQHTASLRGPISGRQALPESVVRSVSPTGPKPVIRCLRRLLHAVHFLPLSFASRLNAAPIATTQAPHRKSCPQQARRSPLVALNCHWSRGFDLWILCCRIPVRIRHWRRFPEQPACQLCQFAGIPSEPSRRRLSEFL